MALQKKQAIRDIIMIQTAWRFINRISFVSEQMDSSQNETYKHTRVKEVKNTRKADKITWIVNGGLCISRKLMRYTQNVIHIYTHIHFKGSVKMKKRQVLLVC
jgi:hypothetical protein